MAPPVAVDRPPAAHPGPNSAAGTLHSQPDSGGPNPGLQAPGQEPGPQQPRPVFYVPVPPPPPFLHYQWPMPFSYNPFAGFPGMGYGMVMPPFPPPPPYMDAPAYVLPHPHMQPIDYRRLLHPPVHAPYQNPNQAPRRTRPPPPSAAVREKVNSEVQTESSWRGGAVSGEESPLISSDSGHGTTSHSPSSSNSHERGSADVLTYRNQRLNGDPPAGAKILQPGRSSAAESRLRRGENVPSFREDLWSVGSADSMVPVCSSSQQDHDVTRERRVSIPDILLSGATPQTMTLERGDENQQLLPSSEIEVEKEKKSEQRREGLKSKAENSDVQAGIDADVNTSTLLPNEAEPLYKILRLPATLQELLFETRRDAEPSGLVERLSEDELLRSLNHSSENTPYQSSRNRFLMRSKLNESIWSVESLPAFIPTQEWMQQNGLLEPEVIIETINHDGGQQENFSVKGCKGRNRSHRLSSSESARMSESWLVFSTPAEKLSQPKKMDTERRRDSSGTRELGHDQSPSGKVCSSPPPQWQSRITAASPPEEDQSDKTGSSEPNSRWQSRIISSPPPEEDRSDKNRSSEPNSQWQSRIISSPPPEEDRSDKNRSSEPDSQWQSRIISSPTKEDGSDDNRSSEPEAHGSPNQELVAENEQTERSPGSPEQDKTVLSNSSQEGKPPSPCQLVIEHAEDVEAGQKVNDDVSELRVPMVDHATVAVSPSKVDCGVQWPEQSESKSPHESQSSSSGQNKRTHFNHSEMKKTHNKQTDGFCMNGQSLRNQRRSGHWRNRGQENHSGQSDCYSGFSGKPGRSKGGNGRNQRY
ncbi:uncharacterized protein LOC121520719 [Cheilinus undulatus]|uniref:uncharacterized protein LOC121520719 n=1 Tax=Cheilinus undulatus TaxID=241271 RepID=UPI001BD2559A|nr:uncharacterized protein LOC121520719 [Cheilinus undulatus]